MTFPESVADYTVAIDPLKLELVVELILSGPFVKDGMVVTLASWVPGYYHFEPYGRDLFDVEARDAVSGAELRVKRHGLDGYCISGVTGRGVSLRYTAFAYNVDLGEATGLVDSAYAVLMGTRYLFCPDYLGPCRVAYCGIPDHWKTHHPSGAVRVGSSNQWVYPSFEILLDTPVVFGDFTTLTRSIRDVPFYFVFVDRGVGFDARVDAFVDCVQRAVEAIHDVFGVFPFEDYTFVLSLNPQAEWGLEHLTSNLSGIGPDVFVDDGKFATGINVCAHELFHAWVVRRLRPMPLGQLSDSLTSGCFTEGLWMAEGFARYYEFLISTRAGAYTPDQFFSAIVGYDQHLTQQPAYRRVSAADSSLSTYLNHTKYPGRVNNSIDYYDKGMLIAFAIDSHLRTSGSTRTLDRALRDCYLEFFGDGTTVPPDYVGYSTNEVISFFNSVDDGLGDWIGKLVTESGGLETSDALARLGLESMHEDTYCVGIFFLDEGAPTIFGVADNMPAAVGLAPGDVIEGVNGFAYTRATLGWAAASPAPITLSIRRGHRMLDFTMTPEPRVKRTGLKWTGNDAQADMIAGWLGAEFAPVSGQLFAISFYENFHGIETMI